jgi:outer membrane receptor protein involved in Fe transport
VFFIELVSAINLFRPLNLDIDSGHFSRSFVSLMLFSHASRLFDTYLSPGIQNQLNQNTMKTTKLLILAVFLISSFLKVQAQAQGPVSDKSASIQGVILDADDSSPIPFADVVLFTLKDSTLVSGTNTNDKGSFELAKLSSGEYMLTVSFMGYQKYRLKPVIVGKAGSTLNVGTIKLKPETMTLQEVAVVGMAKTVTSKIDRKVIDVSKDINSTGGTAVDLIRNIPGVQVDADGAVSIRGNAGVSILIDGRPTSIDATKLDQILSSEVQNIEIITNPSARYNPEGKSGIINFKMKQNKTQGLNGSAMLTAGTGDKYNGNFDLSYNLGKINLFANYSGMHRNTETSRFLYRESFSSDTIHFLQQDAKTKIGINSNKFTFGTNLFFNDKNSLKLSFTTNPVTKTDGDGTLSQYFDRSKNLTQSIFTDNMENESEKAQDYQLGYKKLFDLKGEELTMDYSFSNSTGTINQPQTFHFPTFTKSSEIFTATKQFNSDLQINWILPISESSKFESGIQSIVRGTDNDFSLKNLVGNSWTEDLAQKNQFTYNEQIHSIYSTWSGKMNNLSVLAGLRLEQTLIDGTQQVGSKKFDQKYFNFYPSLSLQYQLNSNNNLQFSFSRRINRPNARMINPFVDRSNLEMYRSGNPDLVPEYINSLDFSYNGTWNKTNYGVTLFYKKTNYLINTVTTLDAAGISHMAPQNIATGQNFGIEASFEQSLNNWWKINGNGSFYRNTVSALTSDITNKGYSYYARLNSVITPVKTFSIQAIGNYTGPMIGVYSKMKPQFSVDLALKKDFLNNKLTATLRATDIFNTLKNTYTSWGPNFTADNWRKTETRVVYFSLAWKFGSNNSSKGSKNNGNIESTHSKEIF